jgi:serine/threonine protein kinase
VLNNGAVIADRYRLLRLIATGGMGQVWEATDNRLGRRVAVKVLKTEFSSDPTFRERFRTEARTTAQLNHPGIAGVYDYGETRDAAGAETAYLVMELVRGEPLNAVLGRIGRLSIPHALDMLEQTGRALAVAHTANVVHRDVKPGNILITPTGQVKITDFGIAKAVDSSPVTQTGMVMGTAQYIAPEQAMGQEASSASDIYSLGVVGYEALAGQRPFVGDGPVTVAMKHVREAPAPMPADIPANIRQLIDITLAKDPATRYADGTEFADAVAAVAAGHNPPLPGGTSSRVLPPVAAGSTALLTSQTGQYGPDPADYAADDDRGFTPTQKLLAWTAGGLLLAALLLGTFLLLDNGGSDPVAPTTTVVAPPPVAPPPTTRQVTTEPEPTTTEETTTTTTTTTTEPTTTEPTTTEPTTTTTTRGGLIPNLPIPTIPGAFGDPNETVEPTTTTFRRRLPADQTTTTPAAAGNR